MPASLFGGGIHGHGTFLVENNVVYASVLAYLKHLFPGFPAVFGAVEPAVAARAPCRAFSGHKDHIGILGMDGDHAYLARFFEAHVLP